MKILVRLAAACSVIVVFAACGEISDKPDDVARRVIDDLIGRSDYMMYRSQDFSGFHYAEAASAQAAIAIADTLGDDKRLEKLRNKYQSIPGIDSLMQADHVDASVIGIVPLQFYLSFGDERQKALGMHFADDQWQSPREDGLTRQTRFWIDDIWMIGSLQVQAFRASGNTIYLDRVATQVDAYLRALQQPNGLFHHGSQAPFYWGRGNGWVAAGLAVILSELPPEHPRYRFIASGYRKMMDALLRYQAEDGMWRQLIDQPEAWKETSSTAMFGYAMAVGVRKGLLEGKSFIPAYRKAWDALLHYIDEEGLVSDVCVGTGQSQDINYYLNRPRTKGDLHGQLAVLWFADSMLKAGRD